MRVQAILFVVLVCLLVLFATAHPGHRHVPGRGHHLPSHMPHMKHKIAERLTSMQANQLMAGASKVDATLPIGVPLAGFNWGARRVPKWPLPQPTAYTTFMMPSTGVKQPTWAKALVIDDGSGEASGRVAFLTIDAIGADGTLCSLAHKIATEQGFTIPEDNFICSASHTHSGPGAVSPEKLWALAPATDLLVPALQTQLASSMAAALVEAETNMRPAAVGVGIGNLVGVTRNRRAHESPYVNQDTIDPHLGIIRVDNEIGEPIAVLFNFAVHGTCQGPSNMEISGDIAGVANMHIEEVLGVPSLFMNADAGDIDPTNDACASDPTFENGFMGSRVIAQAVLDTRSSIQTFPEIQIEAASNIVDFGSTDLNITLSRWENCTSGGPLDICSICEIIKCDADLHLDSTWVEDNFRFTAINMKVNGVTTAIVTMPGEPLIELGWMVRNTTAAMGFDQTFLAGYSNHHAGYFCTANEYDIGGYESQLTFFGIDTAERIRAGVESAAKLVAPQ